MFLLTNWNLSPRESEKKPSSVTTTEPWQTELKESSQTEHQKSQVSPEWLGSLDTKKQHWWWLVVNSIIFTSAPRFATLPSAGSKQAYQTLPEPKNGPYGHAQQTGTWYQNDAGGYGFSGFGVKSCHFAVILEWWVSSWGEWIDSYQFPKHYAEQAALQKTTVRSPGLQCLTKQSSFGNSKPVGPIWSNLPTNLNPISMNQPHVMSNIILGGFRWNMIIYDMIRL